MTAFLIGAAFGFLLGIVTVIGVVTRIVFW